MKLRCISSYFTDAQFFSAIDPYGKVILGNQWRAAAFIAFTYVT